MCSPWGLVTGGCETPRAIRATLAPLLAKARVVARPTPAEAPVTTTTSLAVRSPYALFLRAL